MQISYGTLLAAVAPVFAIVVAGFIIRRTRLLTAEADQGLLKVCVSLLYPCLIFDTVIGNPALDRIENLVLPPVVGFATFCIGYVFALRCARWLKLSEKQSRTFSFTTGSYNYGYVPIPLVLAFFSRETM